VCGVGELADQGLVYLNRASQQHPCAVRYFAVYLISAISAVLVKAFILARVG